MFTFGNSDGDRLPSTSPAASGIQISQVDGARETLDALVRAVSDIQRSLASLASINDLRSLESCFESQNAKLHRSIVEIERRELDICDALRASAEEQEAVRDCLYSSELLSAERFEEQLRARRFRRMLNEVFQVQELSMNVGLYVGFSGTRHLMGVSREFCSGMQEALLELSSRLLPQIYVCGGRRDGNCLATFERFDASAGQWEALPSMPMARYGCAATAVNGCFYVFGGHGGGPLLSTAERFNVARGRWENLPNMPTVRASCTVSAVGGHLYIVGGFDGRVPLATAERYDPIGFRWEVLHPMPTARHNCTSSVLAGSPYMFVFGGHGVGQPLATAERYNTVTGQWAVLAKMPTARHSCASVGGPGQLYVFGGFDGRRALAVAERLDATTCRWETLADMPTCRYEFGAARIMGRLYIFGGHDGHQALSESCYFNVQLQMWVPLQDMTAPRSGCACAALML